jgi:hypothetical protein
MVGVKRVQENQFLISTNDYLNHIYLIEIDPLLL